MKRKYAKVPRIIDDYVSITDASYIVGVSPITMKRWIKWWESDKFEKPEELNFPQYYYFDKRKTKYFKQEDIAILKDFKLKLQTTCYGAMSDFNKVYQYGKRGEEICDKQGKDYKELKHNIKKEVK